MTKKISVSICLLIFILPGAWSQEGSIKVRFIGNCGVYMTDGKNGVYVDFPYRSGAFHYMTYTSAELDSIRDQPIFVFTHRHGDHYSRKLTKGHNAKIFGPWNVLGKKRLDTAAFAKERGIGIQAFRNRHRLVIKHCSFLVTWHGKRIYFNGDAESAETILQFKDLDWAFVPYWIFYDAERRKARIDSKMRALYHLYPNQKIEGEYPPDVVVLRKEGQVIEIPY